jgi:glycogen debranching enzyme
MSQVLRIDQYSIVATSTRVDDRTRVLKQGETFAVFDRLGDIVPVGQGELGMYHEGTRFLSELRLLMGDDRPLLLSSSVKLDNTVFTADLTNPDVLIGGKIRVPRGTVHVGRQRVLWAATWYERIRIVNYGLEPIAFSIALEFRADFADIFEVRGTHRARRGRLAEPLIENGSILMGYEGLDRVRRRTRIEFPRGPHRLEPQRACWDFSLGSQQEEVLFVNVACEIAGSSPPRMDYPAARQARGEEYDSLQRANCRISTSQQQLDRWIGRSLSDLTMMITKTPEGEYPFAGVPWFSTPFGRDGILTALECLWVNPRMAQGVLAFLAATQARQIDPQRDA